jgi:hypothetical protein
VPAPIATARTVVSSERRTAPARRCRYIIGSANATLLSIAVASDLARVRCSNRPAQLPANCGDRRRSWPILRGDRGRGRTDRRSEDRRPVAARPRRSAFRRTSGAMPPNAGTALPVGDPAGGSLDLKVRHESVGPCEHGGQVAITPMIHTTVARRTDMSSTSIETPTARRAAFVDGQAIRGPTRWSSDK